MLVLAVVVAGCGPDGVEVPDDPDEAPEDLDELVHFFWLEMDGGDAALVGTGTENLSSWYDASDQLLDGWFLGTVSGLDDEELTVLEQMEWSPDPSLAVGVLVVTELECSLDQTIAINLEPDQLALFPGNYSEYTRTFDSDPDCFADGDCDVVDWHSAVTDSVADLYVLDYGLITRMRRFRFTGSGGGDAQAVLARNYMPTAAEDQLEDAGFDQSYHIEAYVPRDAAHTLHMYGLWNHGYLEDIPADVPFWTEQYLQGLVDWDERVAELCSEGW